MTTAREIMHEGVECIQEDDTLELASAKMREFNVGALPVCGPDDRLHGIITDRDIVVRCCAEGRDPRTTTAGDLARGTPIWVEADADLDEAMRRMTDNKIRRLPVIDDHHRLVGMISEADIATHLDDEHIARFASSVYAAPPTPV
jgi:CBS domain-containing protein